MIFRTLLLLCLAATMHAELIAPRDIAVRKQLTGETGTPATDTYVTTAAPAPLATSAWTLAVNHLDASGDPWASGAAVDPLDLDPWTLAVRPFESGWLTLTINTQVVDYTHGPSALLELELPANFSKLSPLWIAIQKDPAGARALLDKYKSRRAITPAPSRTTPGNGTQ